MAGYSKTFKTFTGEVKLEEASMNCSRGTFASKCPGPTRPAPRQSRSDHRRRRG